MERFWSRVKYTNTCWIWTGCTRGKSGYGCLKYKGKVIDAHRMAYMFIYGYIPKGMLVCHTCDNRLCVNPEHLFIGTYYDNNMDAIKKGRMYLVQNARKVRGERHGSHKLTEKQVLTIREEYSPTNGCRRLARKYGVDKSTILKVYQRKTWQHI